MQLLVLFDGDHNIRNTANTIGLHRNTVSKLFRNLRQKMYEDLNNNPIEFLDVGIYEADETQIKNMIVQGDIQTTFWIAGILERATGNAIIYTVASRDANHIMPTINASVPRNSLICTNGLMTYRDHVQGVPVNFIHRWVNHNQREYVRYEDVPGFNDEDTNNTCITTTNIENFWNVLKRRIRFKCCNKLSLFHLFLAETRFRIANRNIYDLLHYEHYLHGEDEEEDDDDDEVQQHEELNEENADY
eukprot:gene18268-21288_t